MNESSLRNEIRSNFNKVSVSNLSEEMESNMNGSFVIKIKEHLSTKKESSLSSKCESNSKDRLLKQDDSKVSVDSLEQINFETNYILPNKDSSKKVINIYSEDESLSSIMCSKDSKPDILFNISETTLKSKNVLCKQNNSAEELICFKSKSMENDINISKEDHAIEESNLYDQSETQPSPKNETNQRYHFRNKRKLLRCLNCQKSFKSQTELDEHQHTHTDEKPSCNVCNKSFSKKGSLMTHLRIHLKDKKIPFECTDCNKTFMYQSSFLIHVRTHSKEKPFECKECHKGFAQKYDMIKHNLVHTQERAFTCEVCGRAFARKNTLRIHLRTHTKEKPYNCSECDRNFATRHHLKKHFRIHTDEKPYPCTYCEKKFSRKDYLTQHFRVHTKVKPYSCVLCDKSFSQKSSLTTHYRVHSKELPSYEPEVDSLASNVATCESSDDTLAMSSDFYDPEASLPVMDEASFELDAVIPITETLSCEPNVDLSVKNSDH